MKGSIVLAEAESREEVIRILKEDIYSKSEVWDWSKVGEFQAFLVSTRRLLMSLQVQIYPFLCALRKGKEAGT